MNRKGTAPLVSMQTTQTKETRIDLSPEGLQQALTEWAMGYEFVDSDMQAATVTVSLYCDCDGRNHSATIILRKEINS